MNQNKFTINQAIYNTQGKNDECMTPDWVVKAILPYIPRKIIWCPFDKEDSAFVRILKENGYIVRHSHISNGQDFYNYEPEQWDIIVSNPPFTNKRLIFDRALSFNKPFMLLMTAQWLNDAAPVQLYQEHKAELELIHFDKRIEFFCLRGDNGKVPFKSLFFCRDILPYGNVLLSVPKTNL